MARELGHVLLVCLLQVVLTSSQPAENIAEPVNTSRAKVNLDNADDVSSRIIKSPENIYNSHEVELGSHEHYPHIVGQHAFAVPQQRSIEVEIDYDDSTGQWNTGNNVNAYNEPYGRLAPEPVSENNFSPLIVKWLPLYINAQDLPNSINVHLNKKISENNQSEKDKNPNRWFNVPDRYGNIMPNAPLPPESANPRMRFQSPPVLKAGDYSGRFIADPPSSTNPNVELSNLEGDSSVLSASGRSNMSDKLDVQDASGRIHMSDQSETHTKLDKSDASERSGMFDDYKKTDIPQTTDRPFISTTTEKSYMYETTKNTNIPVSNTPEVLDVSEKSDTSNVSIVSGIQDAAERSDMSDADNKAHIPEISSRSDVSGAVERSDMAIPTSPTNMPEASERFDMSESYNKTDNSAAFNRTGITNASERSDILNVSNTDASNMPHALNNIDSNSTEMPVATVKSNIPAVSGRTDLQNISENLDAIDVSDTTDVVDKSDFSDMYDSSEEVPAEQRYLLMQFLKYWRDKIMFARSGQAAGMQYNPRTSDVAPRSIYDQNSAQADHSSRKYRMAPNNREACKDHMEDGQ